MRLVGTFLAFTLATSSVFAADLFKDGKPVPMKKGSEIAASTTISGYPMYLDSGAWRLVKIETSMPDTLGAADSLSHGEVTMLQVDATSTPVASMAVLVNLTSTGDNLYMGGSPCAGAHIVSVNKGAGLYDNCLTIDANASDPSKSEGTNFAIRITQSRSGGRLYILDLRVLASVLGVRGTYLADWQADAIQASAEKKAFVERLKKWAVSLQDASSRAVEFSKPADAFAAVPSYRTLVQQ